MTKLFRYILQLSTLLILLTPFTTQASGLMWRVAHSSYGVAGYSMALAIHAEKTPAS